MGIIAPKLSLGGEVGEKLQFRGSTIQETRLVVGGGVGRLRLFCQPEQSGDTASAEAIEEFALGKISFAQSKKVFAQSKI